MIHPDERKQTWDSSEREEGTTQAPYVTLFVNEGDLKQSANLPEVEATHAGVRS